MVLGIARGFCQLGVDIDMLTPFAGGAQEKLVSWGLDVGLHSLSGNRWQRKKSLRKYLRNHDCAGLICAGHRMNTLGSQFASRELPVVSTVHNNASQSISGKSFFKKIAFRKQLQSWEKKSRAVVAVSEGVADDLKSNFGFSQISVIHNPIDIDYLQERSKAEIDHPWLSAKNGPVIIAVGRLTAQKDYPNLIRAFSLLRETLNAKLIILGEGDLRAELETLVAELGCGEYVSMPGFVDNPFAYVAKADLFCLSSAWEGFGNVIVEAMAVGTPVVSTDCPSGPSEILNRGEYGLLVPINNHAALAEALISGLKNSQPAPAEAITPFAVNHVAEAYAACLGYEIK